MRHSTSVLTLTLMSSFMMVGCGDDTTSTSMAADMAVSKPADMAVGGDMATASRPMAKLRIAHLSPDTPAVDICAAAAGTSTFMGPLLKAAGDTAGLSYTQLTNYLPVPAATIDVRVVAAGAADCNTKLIPDTTGVALAADTSYTVAAIGLSQVSPATIKLQAYVDETAVATGMAKLRFIHTSPGTPSVDVGTLSGTTLTPIFTATYPNVGGNFGSGTAGDAKGYVQTAPLPANAQVGVRLTGMTAIALTVTLPAGLPANAIATAFAIGLANGTGMQKLQALVCVDNVAGTGGGGLLANCTPISM